MNLIWPGSAYGNSRFFQICRNEQSWSILLHSYWGYVDRSVTNLVLDEQLDTLDRGSSSLRDGSGHTAHYFEISN